METVLERAIIWILGSEISMCKSRFVFLGLLSLFFFTSYVSLLLIDIVDIVNGDIEKDRSLVVVSDDRMNLNLIYLNQVRHEKRSRSLVFEVEPCTWQILCARIRAHIV